MLRPCYGGGGAEEMVYNLYSPIKDKIVSFKNRGGKEEVQLMRRRDTVVVGSSHGWLAMYNLRSHDVFLSNPLSGRRIHLPPYAGEPFHKEEPYWCPEKVILSCSPDNSDCRALMVLGSSERAAFCLPGRSDCDSWSPLGRWYKDTVSFETSEILYVDFAYCAARKNFLGYAMSWMSGRQELEGWDVTDPVRPRTVGLDRFGEWEWRPEMASFSNVYVVCGEEPDQLFLVRRIVLEEEELNVIVYRIEDGELVRCSSLGDMTMFVGINHSVAVKASRIPGLKPNCIYFCDSRNSFGELVGVFDYGSRTCSPVYHTSILRGDALTDALGPSQAWFTPTLD